MTVGAATNVNAMVNSAVERDAPFQLRGNSFTMMVLKVNDPSDPEFFAKLGHKVRQAPNFFRNAPVVLDLDDLPTEQADFDLAAFLNELRQQRLIAIGIQGGTRQQQEKALAAGLPMVPAGRATRLNGASTGPADSVALEMPYQKTTMVVTEPVRSGRQVYAPKGDLVVAAAVSAGAELLADGSIHVYGPLRGRALAGIGGDTSARIFCQSLEAELVSIAGLYRVSEDIDRFIYQRSVQVFLEEGFLRMEPLC